MRSARPIRLSGLVLAVTLAMGGAGAHAQSTTADAFCALFTPKEMRDVLGVKVKTEATMDGCTWASTKGGGLPSATAGWYGSTIADHKALWPDGTDLLIGGRTAYFSPGMFLQEMLIQFDAEVLHLTITGFDGDVEAALVELGELAVARSASLPTPVPEPTMPSMDADPALEALFPGTVGGEPLVVQSLAGDEAIPDPEVRAAVVAALGVVGKTLDDLTFAFAATPTMSVAAIRVAGADASAFVVPLMEGFYGPDVAMAPAQVAGKDVGYVASVPGYVYPAGEVVWMVMAEEPALTEILAALP